MYRVCSSLKLLPSSRNHNLQGVFGLRMFLEDLNSASNQATWAKDACTTEITNAF